MRKLLVVLAIVIVALYTSVFTIQQGERGLVLRFGKVLRDNAEQPLVYTPGLHFKVPFIDQVKKLDYRIQTMDNKEDRFVTKEKKDLIVDSYLKWRISDFGRYYQATGSGDISQAEVLLKRKFSDRLRSLIGSKDIKDIVTDSRGQLMQDVRDALNSGTSSGEVKVEESEAEVRSPDNVLENKEVAPKEVATTNPTINPNSMAALGIEVIDVRIKQINLPVEVYDAIYQRMRAEREAVARRHRSQGMEAAEKLRATTDYEVTRTLAEAEKQAIALRGEGDAEATKLLGAAYSSDPSFYAFSRSLRAYENSFKDNKDILVLKPDSEFFRYMRAPSGTSK
ncbi:MAG: protease modulator HflC [Enterobacteriaceae bacterium]